MSSILRGVRDRIKDKMELEGFIDRSSQGRSIRRRSATEDTKVNINFKSECGDGCENPNLL